MKLKLIWIRHAESISNLYKHKFNIHPFLTYKGLLQSLELGEKLSGRKINTVYCSPFIRTILTSLISISIYNLENENNSENLINKIKIISYISEINPIIYYFGNNKYSKTIQKLTLNYYNQNKIQNYKNIFKLTKMSIDWLNSNMVSFLLKEKIILLLETNKNINYIDKIKKIKKYNYNEETIKKKILNIVKTNNLENEDKIIKLLNFKLDFNLLDFTNINELNIPNNFSIYSYLMMNSKSNYKILLFSHNYYIKKITNNNLNINNCDIYKENVLFENNNFIKVSKKNILFDKNINHQINNYIEKNNYIIKNIQKKINNFIKKNK